jgi:hypothetical protein
MSTRQKSILFTGVVLACVFVLMAGSSQALPFSGQIWTRTSYNFSTHDLTNLTFSSFGSPAAQFTVDEINFDSEALTGSYGGSVTYTQFLSNSMSGAPGPNDLVWADLASEAFGAGTILTSNSTASFFQFTGTAFFPATFTIRHDDGFDLYINGQEFDNSYPTAPTDATITLADKGLTAGTYSFTLNYAAWNGFPEVLTDPDIPAVPEPATMFLLGSGLIGLAGFARRKFKK